MGCRDINRDRPIFGPPFWINSDCVRKRKRKKSREDPEPLRPPIPFGSVVQLSGLPETTGCNGRTALFKSWEPEFARAFVQLLPPGMSAGEMRVVRTCHLELVR